MTFIGALLVGYGFLFSIAMFLVAAWCIIRLLRD
jgi:hypothetical protein